MKSTGDRSVPKKLSTELTSMVIGNDTQRSVKIRCVILVPPFGLSSKPVASLKATLLLKFYNVS